MRKEFSLRERLISCSDSPLNYYLAKANLTVSDLRGKRILNVGAGRTDLQKELQEREVTDCTVVNIDLAYDSKRTGRLYRLWKIGPDQIPQLAVRGDFKRLPFKNGAFDIAFAANSVGSSLVSNQQTIGAIAEIMRVSSKAYIFPILSAATKEQILQKGDVLAPYETRQLPKTDAIRVRHMPRSQHRKRRK